MKMTVNAENAETAENPCGVSVCSVTSVVDCKVTLRFWAEPAESLDGDRFL
jgi:hypothetical protein